MMNDNEAFLKSLTLGYAKLSSADNIPYHYHPRTLVYQKEFVKLYHYQSLNKNTDSTPLLIVFATVNRPEILDLLPNHSFIGELLQRGVDVYLLDWGYPTLAERHVSISDYVTQYLHSCVQYILNERRFPAVNLLGICQGGLLSVCYASMFNQIKNLILISTPIDFQTKDNAIGNILSRIKLDTILDNNIPGRILTHCFVSLRPFDSMGKKYLRYIDRLHDEKLTNKFIQVEKWLHDVPDQTAMSFVELVNDFYQENKLIKGEIILDGKQVKLANICIPVLNIMAKQDEIIPMSASRVLKNYIGSYDYVQKMISGGHIGIYINDKTRNNLARTISTWLNKRI